MTGKKCRSLRRLAIRLATSNKGIQLCDDGSHRWPEGTKRRIYRDLKKAARRHP